MTSCRAFLSPWYERGGMYPADEKDTPVFVGRFNIGAVSLHLPMIYAKAKQESKDFYEVLDYYLELIRQLHIRTYDYLGELKASTNPLAYCEGGFYGGNLGLYDKIKPLLKAATASFGTYIGGSTQNTFSLMAGGIIALHVTSCKPSQQNALFPISSTLLPIVREVIREHFPNASSLIIFTLLGISTEVKAEHQ